GLADTLGAVKEETSQLTATLQRTGAITIKQLSGEIQSCGNLLSSAAPATFPEWVERFEALNEHASVIDDIVAALAQEHGGDVFSELRWWRRLTLRERSAHVWPRSRMPPSALSTKWISSFCSIRNERFSRSASTLPKAGTTTPFTIYWLRKRAWRASSRSQKATWHRNI